MEVKNSSGLFFFFVNGNLTRSLALCMYLGYTDNGRVFFKFCNSTHENTNVYKKGKKEFDTYTFEIIKELYFYFSIGIAHIHK